MSNRRRREEMETSRRGEQMTNRAGSSRRAQPSKMSRRWRRDFRDRLLSLSDLKARVEEVIYRKAVKCRKWGMEQASLINPLPLPRTSATRGRTRLLDASHIVIQNSIDPLTIPWSLSSSPKLPRPSQTCLSSSSSSCACKNSMLF